jgi:hypothetical protein
MIPSFSHLSSRSFRALVGGLAWSAAAMGCEAILGTGQLRDRELDAATSPIPDGDATDGAQAPDTTSASSDAGPTDSMSDVRFGLDAEGGSSSGSEAGGIDAGGIDAALDASNGADVVTNPGDASLDALSDDSAPDAYDAGPSVDAPLVDAPTSDVTPPCDRAKPFGSPVAIAELTSTSEAKPSLTADELTIYFDRTVGTSRGLYVARRAAITNHWGAPSALSTINVTTNQADPSVAPDGKTLFFVAPSMANGFELYWSNALDPSGAFLSPMLVPNVNTTGNTIRPYVNASASEVWFTGVANGGPAIFHATWAGSTFSAPIAHPELGHFYAPVPSSDKLTLYFGVNSAIDVATRESTSSPFGAPTAVAELNDAGTYNAPGWLSLDGCRMYFESDRSASAGMSHLWVAARP